MDKPEKANLSYSQIHRSQLVKNPKNIKKDMHKPETLSERN